MARMKVEHPVLVERLCQKAEVKRCHFERQGVANTLPATSMIRVEQPALVERLCQEMAVKCRDFNWQGVSVLRSVLSEVLAWLAAALLVGLLLKKILAPKNLFQIESS